MLIGDQVLLRDVAWGDLEAVENWFADPEVSRYLTRGDGVTTGRDAIQWTIALRQTGEPVGVAQLSAVSTAQSRARFGLAIGRKDLWGRGIGGEVVRLASDYAFGVMGLDRLELTVDPDHAPARRLYDRSGFREDGWTVEGKREDGSPRRVILMVRRRDDWISPPSDPPDDPGGGNSRP